MRKWNAALSISIIILFLIHAVIGGFQLSGIFSGGNSIMTVLAWLMVCQIALHTLFGCILTVQTLSAQKKAGAVYWKLGIASLRNVKPSELTGGELRRMSIARAVIRKPPFIFADEPTGDLDDENTQTVFRFLREASDCGAAVAVVTHEQGIEQYADRLFRMDAGVLHEI